MCIFSQWRFLLVAFLGYGLVLSATSKESPQIVPSEGALHKKEDLEAILREILAGLGAEEFEAREKASSKLVALGSRAVPMIARFADHHDPEVATRIRSALIRMKGTPGAVVEGLTLSAALVGQKPRPGESVTLWLSITNTSDNEIHLLQYFWSLALQPEQEKGTNHARTIGVSTPATITAQDFLLLRPGQTVGYLMDADPIPTAQGASLTNAYLEIALPEEARKAVTGVVFTCAEELVSGPIEMAYAEEAPTVGAEALRLGELLQRDPAQAKVPLEAAISSSEPDKVRAAMQAIDIALRNPDADKRWSAFNVVCQLRDPRLEDVVVSFLGRFGPRIKQEDRMLEGIRGYAQGLPKERRPVYMRRVAEAIIHDWRSVTNLARDFTISMDPGEREFALHAFGMLFERGDRRPEVLNWLAEELFRTPNLKLRNATKALELSDLACKAVPDNVLYRFTHASITGDKAEMEAALASVADPSDQNSMAWELATRNPAGAPACEAALKLAQKAVGGTPPSTLSYAYRQETLAVCHAALGDYAAATEVEREAFLRLPAGDGERPNYAQRIVRFAALAKGDKSERPGKVLDAPALKSSGARDVLLELLRTEKEELIRNEAIKLLKACFGSDPSAQNAVKQALSPVTPGR